MNANKKTIDPKMASTKRLNQKNGQRSRSQNLADDVFISHKTIKILRTQISAGPDSSKKSRRSIFTVVGILYKRIVAIVTDWLGKLQLKFRREEPQLKIVKTSPKPRR